MTLNFWKETWALWNGEKGTKTGCLKGTGLLNFVAIEILVIGVTGLKFYCCFFVWRHMLLAGFPQVYLLVPYRYLKVRNLRNSNFRLTERCDEVSTTSQKGEGGREGGEGARERGSEGARERGSEGESEGERERGRAGGGRPDDALIGFGWPFLPFRHKLVKRKQRHQEGIRTPQPEMWLKTSCRWYQQWL